MPKFTGHGLPQERKARLMRISRTLPIAITAAGCLALPACSTAQPAVTDDIAPQDCATTGNHICGTGVVPANVPTDCFTADAAQYDPRVTPGSRIYLSAVGDGLCYAHADLTATDAPEWVK